MTGIQWTGATWPSRTIVRFTEADGTQRARVYIRKDPSRPGTQERRAKRAAGLAWCRGCRAWLKLADVTKNGVCRPCANAEYRAHYAADGRAIRARVHARRRGTAPMSLVGGEYLAEQFANRCAYCTNEATTWDHVRPVARGGQTTPGNIVPACAPCNSSKNDRDVFAWLAATGHTPCPAFFATIALELI